MYVSPAMLISLSAHIFNFSAPLEEFKNKAINRLNRRLEHLTRFKTNTSLFESSPLLVSKNSVMLNINLNEVLEQMNFEF